jgi:PucR C-terminal helix-turn-helix domain/GAF domain/GGDEF-like domain
VNRTLDAPWPIAADRGDAPTMAALRSAISALGEMTAHTQTRHDQDALLRMIVRQLCELTGMPRCSLFLRDESTGLFRGQVGCAGRDIDADVKRLVAGGEADRFTSEILRTRRPVAIVNAREDGRLLRSTVRRWHLRSVLGVPLLLGGEVTGLLFVDPEDRPASFDDTTVDAAATFAALAAFAISQLRARANIGTQIEALSRQNSLLRRAAAADECLIRAAVERDEIGPIAEAVANFTAKPCAVYSEQGGLIAWAATAGPAESAPSTAPDAATWYSDDVRAAIARLSPRDVKVLGAMPDAGLTRRSLIAPFAVREAVRGEVAVFEHRARLTALDAHVATRAARLIALRLPAARRSPGVTRDVRAALLSELVRGSDNVEALEQRARAVGTELTAPRALCLLRIADAATSPMPPIEALAERVARATGREVFATASSHGVTLAVSVDANGCLEEDIGDLCSTIERELVQPDDPRLLIAVSRVCRAPEDYTRAHEEVTQVMRCLTTLATAGATQVLSVDALGPGRLFLASTNRSDAERFLHDALGPLLSSTDGMPELLRTLIVHFENARSVGFTAQRLSVHRNTVRYRLARIEECTGLAVTSNSDDQLTVQLCIPILRLTGLLSEVAGPRASTDSTAEIVPG